MNKWHETRKLEKDNETTGLKIKVYKHTTY